MTKTQHLFLKNKGLRKKALFFSAFLPLSLSANQQLDTILVQEESLTLSKTIQKNSKTVINEENIESFPKGNGDINELLKVLPDIQVTNSNQTSLNAGEISPENISISGGKFYQNNFMIDKASNNSLLDPANNNANAINDVKGHPQEVFIDSDMIKSIEVYDSDVPAEYGRFTGGVVNAKTKHSKAKFFGKVKYRFTNDSLTNFFVNDEESFSNSSLANKQPKFKKNFFSTSVNTPINDSSGLYLSTVFKDSTIPLKYFNEDKNTKRTSYNIMGKYSKYLEDDSVLDLSLIFSPYEEKRFLSNVKNSDFTIKGGGYKAKANYEKEFDSFKLESLLDLSFSQNSREASQNFYNWASNQSKPWGDSINQDTSKEGGFGDIDKTQAILTLKNDFNFESFKTGFEIQGGNASFKRVQDSSIYKVSSSNNEPEDDLVNLLCYSLDACISGDQYASTKTVYHAFDTDVNILTSAAYMQKELEYNNLNLRLGLRYDHNNYMQNHDLAYRTLSTLDIFKDKKTLLSFGANRYYANSFLTYKLREAQVPFIIYTRGIENAGNGKYTPEDWAISSRQGYNKNSYSQLKTPYSDEVSLALNQKVLGGKFKAKWIQRDNKNAFSKSYSQIQPDGYRYYELSNEGKSEHTSLRLSYDKQINRHYFSINWARSETKNSNATYDNEISEDSEGLDIIYYHGEFIPSGSLPKSFDTQPDITKLSYRYKYQNFTLHSFITHKSSYKKMGETSKTQAYIDRNPATGATTYKDATVYELIKYKDITKVDLSLTYDVPTRNKEKLVLKTDIKNIFNEKEILSTSTNTYHLGRQFWFELAYKF